MSNAVKNIKEEKQKCRPFLKWAGGKAKLLQSLTPLLPKQYNNYFEPFIGGGALFFYLQPKRAYISDLNSELVNCYLCIRNNPVKVIEYLKKHIYEKEYFYKLREIAKFTEYENWSNEQKAARLIYLNKTCFNGLYRVNKKGEFNVPFGRYKNPLICDEKNIYLCSQALKKVNISLEDFSNTKSKLQENDFIYLDPPYVPISKSSNFTSYTLENFDIKQQENLSKFCKEITAKGVKFMLSNSSSDLVHNLYKDFNSFTVNAPRSINSKIKMRNDVEELVITNY
ncbi:UNVERIFIED_CONTAM: hypothetical protein GTU68_003140 [Idotea baltica]|nr:hypothetical protein [Idotea baltica]